MSPVRVNFDKDHLIKIHAFIFKYLPHRQPGVVRSDTENWTKRRELEGEGHGFGHVVRYLSKDVEGRIAAVLNRFGGPATLEG